MTYWPKTAQIIVDTEDYYTAKTVDGGARIGLKGEVALQVRPTHSLCSEILACVNEEDAEALFDRCVESGKIGPGWQII